MSNELQPEVPRADDSSQSTQHSSPEHSQRLHNEAIQNLSKSSDAKLSLDSVRDSVLTDLTENKPSLKIHVARSAHLEPNKPITSSNPREIPEKDCPPPAYFIKGKDGNITEVEFPAIPKSK